MIDTKDFISHNNVSLCGRIMKILRTKKDEVRLTLGVARGDKPIVIGDKKTYPLKRDASGKIIREYITIKFFDDMATFVNDNYVVGDFVIISGVVQNVRNHYDNTNAVNIWGTNIAPKRQGERMVNDHNRVVLRGKVINCNVINDNFAIVNVLTKVDKNVKANNSLGKVTETYKSVTPIGYYFKENNARREAARFTKGTWVNITGYVKVKEDKAKSIDGKHKLNTYIYAISDEIIGNIQPSDDELYKEYVKEKK